MYDQLSLETANAATIRLVNSSWANYLTRFLQSLKTVGRSYRTDGAEALTRRLKRTRPETFQHSVRVSRLSRTIGRAYGFDESRLKQLSYAAFLHDVGRFSSLKLC